MKYAVLSLVALTVLGACSETPTVPGSPERQYRFVRFVEQINGCIQRGAVYDFNQSVAYRDSTKAATIRRVGATTYQQLAQQMHSGGVIAQDVNSATYHGPVTVLFRFIESDTCHQGDRI